MGFLVRDPSRTIYKSFYAGFEGICHMELYLIRNDMFLNVINYSLSIIVII